jgi:hypothetical protein
MRYVHLAILIGLSGLVLITQASAQTPANVLVQGHSTGSAASGQTTTDSAAQAINDATAAAVIGALQTRFDGQPVQFRLANVLSERASLRMIALHGRGEIRFDAVGAWLPIRFDALYDSDTQTVQSPSITLGAQQSARDAAALPLDRLQARVGKTMSSDFAAQDVRFDLKQASVIGGDGQHIVVQGSGTATFNGEGKEAVVVQAVYDHRSERWMDASYEFSLVPSNPIVASR